MTRTRAARLGFGMWALGFLAVILLLQGPSPASGQGGIVRIAAEDVKWVPTPGGLGIESAVIEGDPAKPGIYVIRNKFPPGVMSMPHTHTHDRHAIVIKGTWWTGTGPDFKPEATVPVRAGGYMKHPAGAPHFDGAKDEEVILQIVGMGPVLSPRIKPELGGYGNSMKR